VCLKEIKGWFLITVAVFALKLEAQTIKDVSGRLVSKDTISFENIHVFNTSLNRGVVTNRSGEFKIEARINDTLVISSIGLQKKTLVVHQDLYQSKNEVQIEVFSKVTRLNEVILHPYGLSGHLSSDMQQVQKPFAVSNKALGLPEPKFKPLTLNQRRLQTASGFGVTALINVISGRTKKLKALVDLDHRVAIVKKARTLFNDEFIIGLGVHPDKLEQFWYYCECNPNFKTLINEGNYEKTVNYLKANAKLFF
jgi:hypothetical protein